MDCLMILKVVGAGVGQDVQAATGLSTGSGREVSLSILRDLPLADFDKTQGRSFGRMDDSFVAACKSRPISTTTGSHL
jgi:hypothetical protein